MLISRLFVVLEVCNVTPTYRKSWAKNLLIQSDFTLGSSFKVNLWLIGLVSFVFGGCTFLRCTRSSCIHRILWFSIRYAAAARREIFGVNTLRGKRQQLGSPNLQDIFMGGVSFSGKENSLILKNKMAATGISLKIIDIFLLAVSHR